MSRCAFPKTAKIWVERIAQCERSNAPVAQFCQSIGGLPTSITSGNANSLVSPKPARFCVSLPPNPPWTRSRSNSLKQARRREGTAAYHLPHMSPSGRLEVLGVRLSPAAYARRQRSAALRAKTKQPEQV
jgi:hypothetical protein